MVYLGYILPPMNQKLWLEDNKIAYNNYKIDNLLNEPLIVSTISKSTDIPVLNPSDELIKKLKSSFPSLGAPPTIPSLMQPMSEKSIEEKPVLEYDIPEGSNLSTISAMPSQEDRVINEIYNFGLNKENSLDDWKKLLSSYDSLNLKNNSGKSAQLLFIGGKTTSGIPKGYVINKTNISIPEILKKSYELLMDDPDNYKIQITNLRGMGLNNNKGVCNTNHEKNFGNYHLADCSFRKGNLLIYKPRTNSTIISYKNMSPKLTKIVQDIKNSKPHSFKIDDYNELNNNEKKVVEHIINILRLNIPAKMQRVLADENFSLKSRYEILIGELSSGNFGKELIKELKEVLQKMKTNKVITVTKYNNLIKTLNDF